LAHQYYYIWFSVTAIDNYIKYSLDFLRPIKTAEAFEAIDWLVIFPNEHGRKQQAGRVMSFCRTQQPQSVMFVGDHMMASPSLAGVKAVVTTN